MAIENGSTVKVNYTGKLENGDVFDTSEGREPLEFVVGQGQLIPGFEAAVMGKDEGESIVATIPAEQAYGPHHPQAVVKVPKQQFPDHISPAVGQILELTQQGGKAIRCRVTEVDDEAVTWDANHPLAGKDLTFEIDIIEVS